MSHGSSADAPPLGSALELVTIGDLFCVTRPYLRQSVGPRDPESSPLVRAKRDFVQSRSDLEPGIVAGSLFGLVGFDRFKAFGRSGGRATKGFAVLHELDTEKRCGEAT